jgi:D-glutamate cyclase
MGEITRMENIVGRTAWRDISRMVAFAQGNLEAAARSIAEHPRPHIGVVCGFFVRHAEPPSPETDGLNGMGHLAAAFGEVGVPVTVITDAPCAKAVWAVTRVLPHRVSLQVTDVSAESVRRLRSQLETDEHPITHLIAIERCSLGADGLPNGALIAARTGADHLLVSGVANCGAYALVSAVAALRPELAGRLLRNFNAETEKAMLTAAVSVGQAVDDSRVDRLGQLQMSIDRLPLEVHVAIIEALRSVVPAASPGGLADVRELG